MSFGYLNEYRKINSLKKHEIKNIKKAYQGIIVNDIILIAKNKNRFKLLGKLDWVYYPRINILCDNIKNNTVKEYYEELILHEKSPPNEWKDKNKEKKLKEFYDNRQFKSE